MSNLIDQDAFYKRALADFEAYASGIGLNGDWWLDASGNHIDWEWHGLPHLSNAQNLELVRLNFICRTVDYWLHRP